MNDFQFSLLENGLDFMLSALEHLTSASSQKNAHEQKRHLKYALLHICSAIELIFKERLRQEHWSLVYKDVNHADSEEYEKGDFTSVTFQEAIDRLQGICKIEFTDKQLIQLKNLRKRRNQIEHFGAVDPLPAITANVSTMVSFLIDFVESAFLADDLEEEEDLISEIRSRSGSCDALVKQRWKEIQKEVQEAYAVIECPICGQLSMTVDSGTVKCRYCNHTSDSDRAAEDYITRVLGYRSRYSLEKDGGVWPLETCPECGNETLVHLQVADDRTEPFCFYCGSSWGHGQLVRCSDCGTLYHATTGDVEMCGECIRYRIDKDD